jgi:hypothetical protein
MRAYHGEVAEWSNVHDWKSCESARVPRVRIPPSPPLSSNNEARPTCLETAKFDRSLAGGVPVCELRFLAQAKPRIRCQQCPPPYPPKPPRSILDKGCRAPTFGVGWRTLNLRLLAHSGLSRWMSTATRAFLRHQSCARPG